MAESLDNDWIVVTFLIGVIYRISGDDAGSDRALSGADNGYIDVLRHECIPC
jgi:hypothetical protein